MLSHSIFGAVTGCTSLGPGKTLGIFKQVKAFLHTAPRLAHGSAVDYATISGVKIVHPYERKLQAQETVGGPAISTAD